MALGFAKVGENYVVLENTKFSSDASIHGAKLPADVTTGD